MGEKIDLSNLNLVFTTDPDFKPVKKEENMASPALSEHKLRVSLDKKQRKGKKVTLIQGFAGCESDLEELGKSLKTACGVGGSVKNGVILLQGDQRDKCISILLKKGYNQTKRSGG